MPPLVSIVIPVFNGSEFLREAIDSALSQSHPDIEVVVVNDGSRDDGRTGRVALSYGDKIRYVAKENGGVASALNRGIEEASGEYVSWLSHDDAYEPGKLEAQLRYLESLPPERRARTVVFGNCLYMNERSEVYDRSHLPRVPPGRFYEALLCGRVIENLVTQEPFFMNGCTALFPKRLLMEAGAFDVRLRTTQDYDLWFRMCGDVDFVLMDDCVLRSRVHKGQGTYLMRGSMAKEVDTLYSKALDRYSPGSPRHDLDLARTAFALRMDPRRRTAFWRAWRMALRQPPRPSGLAYLFLALLWNQWFAKARIAFISLRRRWRERRARPG